MGAVVVGPGLQVILFGDIAHQGVSELHSLDSVVRSVDHDRPLAEEARLPLATLGTVVPVVGFDVQGVRV